MRQKASDPDSEPFNPWRSLWRAVILQAITDLRHKGRSNDALHDKQNVLRWLNTPDFHTVSHLADYEPSYMQRMFKRIDFDTLEWRAKRGEGRRYLERRAYRMRQSAGQTGQYILVPQLMPGFI